MLRTWWQSPITRRLVCIERKLDCVIELLYEQGAKAMVTFADVKMAAERNAEADAKVLTKLEELKNKPGGPTEEEMQAVINALDAATSADEAAVAVEEILHPAPEPEQPA